MANRVYHDPRTMRDAEEEREREEQDEGDEEDGEFTSSEFLWD